MKAAVDWHEHELAVHQALPDGDPAKAKEKRDAVAMSRHIYSVSRYLRAGFWDYMVEDADDNAFQGGSNGRFAASAIKQWASTRPRPLRIVRAEHSPGDGLLIRTESRAVIEKPKALTWFINYHSGPKTPDDIREICKNILAGMPVEMISELYDEHVSRIHMFCRMMNFKPHEGREPMRIPAGKKADE